MLHDVVYVCVGVKLWLFTVHTTQVLLHQRAGGVAPAVHGVKWAGKWAVFPWAAEDSEVQTLRNVIELTLFKDNYCYIIYQ